MQFLRGLMGVLGGRQMVWSDSCCLTDTSVHHLNTSSHQLINSISLAPSSIFLIPLPSSPLPPSQYFGSFTASAFFPPAPLCGGIEIQPCSFLLATISNLVLGLISEIPSDTPGAGAHLEQDGSSYNCNIFGINLSRC